MKNFRERLAEWRDRHQLSRDRAGSLLGVTGHYVGMIERGDKMVEEESTLARLLSSYERDGLGPESVVREKKSQWGKAAAHNEDTMALQVSRPTFDRLQVAARDRALPAADLADLCINQ